MTKYCNDHQTRGQFPIEFCPLCRVCKKEIQINYYLGQAQRLEAYEKGARQAKRDLYIIPTPPPKEPDYQLNFFENERKTTNGKNKRNRKI